ncbi:phosphonate C-P lyase system protein PhnL [Jiella sp. MQZ9-1]|uniref:Phosphonate C-P lyase system protein PhnL n=1 Tax=Jiella flava TaxID=2816857 RepID=A0A939JWK6_9HYPH|nr:phosphonate C-P lyase system protein PhnL [Jiella flava]MBO0663142.1 phosphonate C-P lyase system protein PhnL [Jiella flava]MCD2471561.1 phosphonate C-P lyase system protein PhnL [Jiella flava]
MRGVSPETRLIVEAVSKSFTNHLRGGVHLPVVSGVAFHVDAGEVVVLGGPSGVGKSSILRMIYGNYAAESGRILLRGATDTAFVDVAPASPRRVIALRRDVVGYVSQFLRAIPRVSALDVVAEPLLTRGIPLAEARPRAAALLTRLNLPEALFELPPATFSGGEKQRVNIARGFLTDHPLLVLDEPTASLDNANRNVVCALIEEKRQRGVAILGIFHDEEVRERIATRIVDVSAFSARKDAA